jgi:hypothetical protein
MSIPRASQSEKPRNGHPTVVPARTGTAAGSEAMEPKGYPTSERYHAEIAHSHETHDPNETVKDDEKS